MHFYFSRKKKEKIKINIKVKQKFYHPDRFLGKFYSPQYLNILNFLINFYPNILKKKNKNKSTVMHR